MSCNPIDDWKMTEADMLPGRPCIDCGRPVIGMIGNYCSHCWADLHGEHHKERRLIRGKK